MSEALLAFFLFILVIVLPLGALVLWLFRREIASWRRRIGLPPAPLPDNVLASGSGRGNPALVSMWAACVVAAITLFAVLTYVASDMESGFAEKNAELERQLATTKAQLFADGAKIAQAEQQLAQAVQGGEQLVARLRGGSILFPILCLVYGAFYHRSIAGTYIYVTSNGVEGKGAGKGFAWNRRLFGFHLGYGQITSVDTTGNAIFIHASGTQYKCYVKNPVEIQRVIVEQRQKAKA